MTEKDTTVKNEVPKRKKRKKPVLKIVGFVAVLALIIFGGFYFVQYQKVNDKYQELSLSADEKNKRTASEVAKLIDLPKDETPDVVLIKDKEKLTNTKASKAFFEKAKSGDLVLAYKKGDLAVIYRPSEKRVIKSDNYQNFIAASNPTAVAIIAPSDQQQTLTNQLESKYSNILVVSKASPKVLNGQSYVVDLSGSDGKTAQDLATSLGLQVGTLPEGETKPSGALFVVVIAPPSQ